MAKPASSNPKSATSFQAPSYRPNWMVFVSCLLIGLLLAVAMLDFSPNQTHLASTAVTERNLVGRLGANTAASLFYAFGLAAWLLPVFLLWIAYISIRNAKHLIAARLTVMAVCIVADAGLAAWFESYPESNYFPGGLGGFTGTLVYTKFLKDILGDFGSFLILLAISAIGITFIFAKDIGAEFEKMAAAFAAWRDRQAELRAERAEIKRQLKEAEAREKRKNAAGAAFVDFQAEKQEKKPEPKPERKWPEPAEDLSKKFEDEPPAPEETQKPEKAKPKAGSPATDTKDLAVNAAGKLELNIVKPEEPKKAAKAVLPQSDDANYQFPPIDLLKKPSKPPANQSDKEHETNANNLLRILGEFGVEVSLGEIHVGPVITRYEVIPAAGVRVEKIAGLDKNIALGMRAQSVRILAPIPGKAAVGVEVPNQHATPVGMRDVLESSDWGDTKNELPIALGKDVSGKPLISDLTKMPHLLIAGATGSGKSVCINSIVASILYSKSPKDVRLLMVDPKIVELKIFNTLPHMLIPVVTEPKKVPAALKWLLREMEQRYQIFAKVGVRNILGFNNRKRNAEPELPPETSQETLPGVDPLDEIEIPDRLPYIVAIIDELADLMMVAPAEIETSIARLAQLARAAGIHLIIATQRPSVNVITGVIKANLPSRIAFQVASQVDSRTILDTKGADTLIGRGDMLFSPPGSSRLVRAQGAFVSDEEVQGLVDFLKRNGPPQYAQEVQEQIDRDPEAEEGEDADGEDGEPGDDTQLMKAAISVLKSTRRASTSMLQRRLRIGYNRAARLMDEMEEKGIVGPENGAQPRDILVDLDSL